MALVDKSSMLYVVDMSRSRLIRITPSGEANLIINARKGGFSQIYDAAVDAEGNIFLLDIERDREGRRIKSEVVLKFSSSSHSFEEIYRVDHGEPTFDRSVAGLAVNWEGECVFVTLSPDAFFLRVCPPVGGEYVKGRYSLRDAAAIFNFFDVDQDGGVLFTTKHGEICRADERGLERLFGATERGKGGNGAIPWDLSTGGDGKIYFTDLGNRGVYSLAPDEPGASREEYGDPETIYYRLSARNGLVAVGESVVVSFKDEDGTAFEEFSVSGAIMAKRVSVWISVILLVMYAGMGAVWLSRFIGKKRSVVKISAAIIIGTLAITAVFSLIVMKNITDRLTREMLGRIATISELVAGQIPAESLSRLGGMGDYLGDDYTAVIETVDDILMNRDEYSGMYCVLYRILDGSIAEVYETDKNHGIVDYPYDWPVEDSDEVEILNTGRYKTYIFPSWVDGGVIFVLSPIYGENGEPIGLIEVGSELSTFKRENQELVLTLFINVVSISIAMIIIMLEVLAFLDARRRVRLGGPGGMDIPVDLARGAVFLVYFMTNISTSFLPIYARDMVQASGGTYPFPVEFLIAVPISADVLMGALAALFGDFICRKLGLKLTAILGAVLCAAGICVEFVFYSIATLIAGFAICGFGCGLTLFLAHLRVAGEQDVSEKDRGFAEINVATASGVNGGVVFGAFLTNWLSQRMVVGTALVFALALIAFSATYFTKLRRPDALRDEGNGEMSWFRFILSPRAFLYLIALVIPVIASGAFLTYFFPIVGFDLGMSESNIGYSFLLNSIVVILFSAPLTDFFSRRFSKVFSLSIWALVYAGSFILFALFGNILSLLAALVLMGLADSFGQSLSNSYYTELPEVKRYGYGRAIGIYNVADNIAQTVGPFVFSYALLIGIGKGIFAIAAGLAALALLFVASALKSRKGVKS
jgi:MFS family permease